MVNGKTAAAAAAVEHVELEMVSNFITNSDDFASSCKVPKSLTQFVLPAYCCCCCLYIVIKTYTYFILFSV